MPVFTSCTIPAVRLPCVGVHCNKVVNLSLCEVVLKSNYEVETPSIYFHFTGDSFVEWCFYSKEERDAEFERILTL